MDNTFTNHGNTSVTGKLEVGTLNNNGVTSVGKDLAAGTVTNGTEGMVVPADPNLTVGGNMKVDNTFTNHGNTSVTGKLEVGTLTNNGVTSVGKDLAAGTVTNGTEGMVVPDEANLSVGGNMTVTGDFTNHGYTQVNGSTQENKEFSGITVGGDLTNNGKLEVTVGDIVAGSLTNAATNQDQPNLDVAGNVSVTNGFTNHGYADIDGNLNVGASVDFDNIDITQIAKSLSSFIGDGSALTNKGTLDVAGEIGITGNLTMNGFKFSRDEGEGDDKDLEFVNDAQKVVASDKFNALFADIGNNGSIINDGSMTLIGSSLTNGGTVNTGSLVGLGFSVSGLIDLDTTITNSGTITVTGSEGLGSVLSDISSSNLLNGIPNEGKALIQGLVGNAEVANMVKVGYVQFSGTLKNESTGTFDAAGLSGLIGTTVENDGTLEFDTLLSIGSTINNNADGKLTVDSLNLIGGTLTNDAKDEANDKAAGSVTVNNSLIAIGTSRENTLIDNAGDMTIKGGGTIGDALTAVAPTFATSDVGQIVTSVLDMSTLSAGYVQMSGKLNNTGNFTVEGGVSGLVAGQINNAGTMSFNDMIVYQGTITNDKTFNADNLVVVESELLGNGQITVGSMIVGGTTINDTTVTVEGQNQLGTLALNAIGQKNLEDLGEVGKFVKGALEATDVKLGYVQVAGNLTNTGSIDANGISGMVGGEINNEGSLSFNEFIAYNGTISNVGQFEADNMVVIGSTLKGELAKDGHFKVGSLIATGSNTNETNVTIEGNNKLGTTVLNAIGTDKLKDLGEVGAYVEDALESANIKLAYAQVGGEFTNKGSITVADGVSGLVAGNLKNEGVLSFNEFVSYQGTIDNAASFNADNMIVVGSELKNAGELTAGALIGAATKVTNTSNMIVTGSDAFADAIESYIPKNEDGTETTYGKLATALLDKAHSVGYVQVGGTLDNAATGTLTATGVDKQVASGLVSGEIANKGTMTFDDFVSISGTIANEGQFKADDLVLVRSSLTNGTHADVENAPTVTAQSLIAAGTTIKNQDGADIDVTGSNVNHLVVDALDAYLPKTEEGSDTKVTTLVKNVLNAKEVKLGLVGVLGTEIENKGTMTVDGVSVLMDSTLANSNKLTLNAQLVSIRSDITNTSDLDAQWILANGGSIVNGQESASETAEVVGDLDADIMGLMGTKFDNKVNANATIDSMLAVGSKLTNEGKLTTQAGIGLGAETKAELKDKLTSLSTAVGIDLNAYVDLEKHVELGYVQVGGSMNNKNEWFASNVIGIGGSIENNKRFEADNVISIDTDFVNGVNANTTIKGQFLVTDLMNDQDPTTTVANGKDATLDVQGVMMVTGADVTNAGTLKTTGGFDVNFGTKDKPLTIDVGYVQTGGSMTNSGTWTTDHTWLAGAKVKNDKSCTITVNGQLFNADSTITNKGTLINKGGVAVGDLGLELGYVQYKGSMNNEGTWLVNAITAFGGSITNSGTLITGDVDEDGKAVGGSVVLSDTDFKNTNIAKINGHLTMTEVALGDYTNLSNSKDLTVTGLTTLNNIKMENTGTLTTGNANIDGLLAVKSELTNTNTWNTTNLTMIGGSLNNGKDLTVFGLMTVGGTLGDGKLGSDVTNTGTLNTTGKIGVNFGTEEKPRYVDLGYLQVAGSMTNDGKWTTDHTMIIGGSLTNTGLTEDGKGLTVLGQLNNAGGEIINSGDLSTMGGIEVDGKVWNAGYVQTAGSMTNTGTWNSSEVYSIGGTITNEKTMTVEALTLLGNAVANNTSGTLTSKQALVSEFAQVNLDGGEWQVEDSLTNEGSIKSNDTMNGTLSLIGGAVASNTMGSTFEVGTLNISGGSTLNHGIQIERGDSDKDILAIGKTLTIKNANIGTSEMTLASSEGAVAKFGSNSVTIADAQSFKGNQFMFESTSNTKLDVDAGATLLLSNVGHGGQYNLAEGFDAANSTVDGTIYTTDDTRGTDLNWLFKVTPGAEGSTLYVNATLESIADSKLYNAGGWNVLHKNIVDEILRTALADKPQASTMSLRATAVADAEVGFTHKMYGDLFMNENITAGTKVMVSNSLASVAQNVGVESLALENVTDTMKGIEERVSMAGSTFADGKMVDGKSSNLWAHVLGGEHKQDGLKSAGGGSLGYDADDRGFMIGYDYLDGANNARCGFALSYIDGNVNSVGTHLGTTADYSTLGLHAYLNWMPTDNVNMIATFGFSRNRAEAEMNLPQLEGWNYSKATADVDTNVLSLGVRAETNFTYNNVNIVPHAGLRVMLIDVDNYDTKVDGNTAFNNSADIAAIGQLPFGVTVKGEFDKNGWNVKPMADLTFVPQFGETKSQTMTTFPGGTVSDMHVAEFTGNFATTMTLGVEAEKGDYSLGMQLGVTKGQNGKTDSNFMAKVRYQF